MEPVPPSRIHIFDSSGSPAIDVDELADYGRGLLGGTGATCYGDFTTYCLEHCDPSRAARLKEDLAVMLTDARVTDPAPGRNPGNRLRPVVELERRMLEREPPSPTTPAQPRSSRVTWRRLSSFT